MLVAKNCPLLWVDLGLSKYVQVLSPGACKGDFICKQGFGGYSQVKVSSYPVRVGPNPMNSALIRRRKFRHGQGRRPREDRRREHIARAR